MKTIRKIFSPIVAVAAIYTFNSCAETPPKMEEPKVDMEVIANHLLSQADAQNLANNFLENNYKLVNAGKNKPDTREIYYDIEVLENYLKYVKQEAKKKQIEDLGIVVVFAQYPSQDQGDAKLHKDYLGQQTIYLKPIEKKQIDSTGNTVYQTKPLRFQTTTVNSSLSDVSALDYGQIIPPRY